MTKLLITENLITNKQDFIKLSNISDGVEFITFNEFLSTTTLSLFEDYSKKFVFDKFVNFCHLPITNANKEREVIQLVLFDEALHSLHRVVEYVRPFHNDPTLSGKVHTRLVVLQLLGRLLRLCVVTLHMYFRRVVTWRLHRGFLSRSGSEKQVSADCISDLSVCTSFWGQLSSSIWKVVCAGSARNT